MRQTGLDSFFACKMTSSILLELPGTGATRLLSCSDILSKRILWRLTNSAAALMSLISFGEELFTKAGTLAFYSNNLMWSHRWMHSCFLRFSSACMELLIPLHTMCSVLDEKGHHGPMYGGAVVRYLYKSQ